MDKNIKKARPKKKEIKFPFGLNARTKAAFRQEAQMRRAIALMTDAIAKVAADIIDPWEILKQEHPEIIGKEYRLRYIQLNETVDVDVCKPTYPK